MKAIVLARVSTEEQKEAGNSLPAQVERLKSYCQRKGLEVAKTFSFDESAYRNKRDEFDKVLDYLKTSKEKVAVCFDKVDRFSRNVFDKRVALLYELAMDDKIELHFASDNLVISPSISATEKFHFGINLGLAKYYSDAISDNVKRAYEQKRRNGEWTGKAPIGYINIIDGKGNRDIVPNPDKAHLIQKLFEVYAAGNHSIRTLRIESARIGLKNAVGNPLSTSMIEHILKNPFYCGEAFSGTRDMRWPHRYPRVISKELFDRCQAILSGWHKKPFQYAAKPFIFRGLLKCARCGCTMSPEIKKGKFVYYSCTNYRKNCERIYVSEKELLGPIYKVLEKLSALPQETIDEVVAGLKKASQYKNAYHQQAITALQKDYNDTQARIDRLMDLLVDGSITKDDYDKKLKEWKEKQYDINLRLEDHTRADESYHVTAGTVLNLAKRALEIFESSEVLEKRTLLNYLLQNSQVNGKKLEFTLRSPFDKVLATSYRPSGLRRLDSNQGPSP